jgi:thiosulfate/3-mercaptopyruvate sulfurtransferase
MRSYSPLGTLVCAVVMAAAAAPARASAQIIDGTPGIVTASWLTGKTADPQTVVLHVDHDGDYDKAHVPGARRVIYSTVVTRRGNVSSELPPTDSLRATFERLGISDGNTVVVYAHEAPMATRVLMSLYAAGVQRVAYLDGGVEAWQKAGNPTEKTSTAIKPGKLSARTVALPTVDAEWITANASKSGVSFLDTRTTGEYNGSGNRSGMPSAGHLAGAMQLEWEDLFSDRMATLKPRTELEKLYRDRVKSGDVVVTYCWVGYRASATWFVAKVLGYDAKLYDGSYQDWQQRQLPTKAGGIP